jgi:hypothetical protein
MPGEIERRKAGKDPLNSHKGNQEKENLISLLFAIPHKARNELRVRITQQLLS